MNKNILHFPLIALLYDELPEDEKQNLLEKMEDNIFLKAEYEELKIAKEMLDKFNFSSKENSLTSLFEKLKLNFKENINK